MGNKDSNIPAIIGGVGAVVSILFFGIDAVIGTISTIGVIIALILVIVDGG